MDSAHAPENILENAPGISSRATRHTLFVLFTDQATQEQKESALSAIDADVIGGMYLGRSGYYYVRLRRAIAHPPDSVSGPLLRAERRLRAFPYVRSVLYDWVDPLIQVMSRPTVSSAVAALKRNPAVDLVTVEQLELLEGKRAPVPALPPDSLPSDYGDSTRAVSGGRHIAGKILPDVVVLGFKKGTPQADRQSAVALVNGVVVGGRRGLDGDGLYLVRVPVDGTLEPLFDAIARLRQLPQVSTVTPEMILIDAPTYLRPNDE